MAACCCSSALNGKIKSFLWIRTILLSALSELHEYSEFFFFFPFMQGTFFFFHLLWKYCAVASIHTVFWLWLNHESSINQDIMWQRGEPPCDSHLWLHIIGLLMEHILLIFHTNMTKLWAVHLVSDALPLNLLLATVKTRSGHVCIQAAMVQQYHNSLCGRVLCSVMTWHSGVDGLIDVWRPPVMNCSLTAASKTSADLRRHRLKNLRVTFTAVYRSHVRDPDREQPRGWITRQSKCLLSIGVARHERFSTWGGGGQNMQAGGQTKGYFSSADLVRQNLQPRHNGKDSDSERGS